MTPQPKLQAAAPVADPLAGLRDYHLPDAPSWWLPAPGWWLLAVLLLVLLAGLAWWWRRRRQRLAVAHSARHELSQLRARLAHDGDTGAFVRDLSKLLRRFAIARFPAQRVAALSGEDWLRFLDAHGGNGRFVEGAGRQLLDAPYRQHAEVAAAELAALVEDWVRHNREVRA